MNNINFIAMIMLATGFIVAANDRDECQMELIELEIKYLLLIEEMEDDKR